MTKSRVSLKRLQLAPRHNAGMKAKRSGCILGCASSHSWGVGRELEMSLHHQLPELYLQPTNCKTLKERRLLRSMDKGLEKLELEFESLGSSIMTSMRTQEDQSHAGSSSKQLLNAVGKRV